jgi:hypothetical protein
MSDQTRVPGTGHFIPGELTPSGDADLETTPLLEPGASKAEIQRQLAAMMEGQGPTRLGQQEGGFSPEMWQTVFTATAEVTSTVLEDEAVLLNLANGVYYSLNPVGTAIWGQLTGSQSLEEILENVRQQFEVTEETARRDLVALVSRLRDEGLIAERK